MLAPVGLGGHEAGTTPVKCRFVEQAGNQFCTLRKCVCACLIKNDNKFLVAKDWLFYLVSPRKSSLLTRISKYSYRTAIPAAPLEEGCDICNTQLLISFFSNLLFCLNFALEQVMWGQFQKRRRGRSTQADWKPSALLRKQHHLL